MSTEENKALIRRIAEEIFNKKNLALADELVDTNYVFHAPGGQEEKGRERFKQMQPKLFTTFPDIRLTIEDMVAEGDKLAYRYTLRGTHKGDFMGIAPTGKQFELSGIAIGRVIGGKIVEEWDSSDMLGMMQQLGVSVIPKK